jgi:transketolase C-terminal domain/subunit
MLIPASLLEKFFPCRVVDTPIAETGFTGLAAGAALVGLRPIVEYQFADFISCAFDPIINVMARHSDALELCRGYPTDRAGRAGSSPSYRRPSVSPRASHPMTASRPPLMAVAPSPMT